MLLGVTFSKGSSLMSVYILNSERPHLGEGIAVSEYLGFNLLKFGYLEPRIPVMIEHWS